VPGSPHRARTLSHAPCIPAWGKCLKGACCGSLTCYEKDSTYAQCQPTGNCTPGVHDNDPIPTPWSCRVLPTVESCAAKWKSCTNSKCCISQDLTCYEKNAKYAQCRPTGGCQPGVHEEDPKEFRTPWSCLPVGIGTPAPAPPTTTSPPAPPCLDLDKLCKHWASRGECDKNAEYMSVRCALSCGVCGKV